VAARFNCVVLVQVAATASASEFAARATSPEGSAAPKTKSSSRAFHHLRPMFAIVCSLRPPLDATAVGSRSSSTPRTGPRIAAPRARRAAAAVRSRSRPALLSCIQDAPSAAAAPIRVLPRVRTTVAHAGIGESGVGLYATVDGTWKPESDTQFDRSGHGFGAAEAGLRSDEARSRTLLRGLARAGACDACSGQADPRHLGGIA
jgi:hypothetical protein